MQMEEEVTTLYKSHHLAPEYKEKHVTILMEKKLCTKYAHIFLKI